MPQLAASLQLASVRAWSCAAESGRNKIKPRAAASAADATTRPRWVVGRRRPGRLTVPVLAAWARPRTWRSPTCRGRPRTWRSHAVVSASSASPRGGQLRDRALRRSFHGRCPTAALLITGGLLVVWLPLDVCGFIPVLAHGWHGHTFGTGSAQGGRLELYWLGMSAPRYAFPCGRMG